VCSKADGRASLIWRTAAKTKNNEKLKTKTETDGFHKVTDSHEYRKHGNVSETVQ